MPFKAVAEASDVRYLGAVKVGGKTFHRVGISGALLIHPNTIPYLFQKEKVDETTLELLIDDSWSAPVRDVDDARPGAASA